MELKRSTNHHVVHPAAQVPGNAAVEDAHDEIQERRQDTDHQGDPRAVQHPNQQVPPQGIGSQVIGPIPDPFHRLDLLIFI